MADPSYPVPRDFKRLITDFAREVLRDQPDDIFDYGANYFAAMEQVGPICCC